MVPKLKKYSYPDRLKMIGITSLKERRVRGDMIEVYKLLTGKEQIDSGQFFTLAQPHYSLRGHEKKLVKERSRLDTRKHFFSQRVINGWNNLPAEVVNSGSVNSFKNTYDRSSLMLQRYGRLKLTSCLQSINLQVQVQVSTFLVLTSNNAYIKLNDFGRWYIKQH